MTQAASSRAYQREAGRAVEAHLPLGPGPGQIPENGLPSGAMAPAQTRELDELAIDPETVGLFTRPDYFEVYTRVAREAGVPCMIPRPTPEAAAELSQYPITAAMLEAKEREGFVLLDRLVTGVPGGTLDQPSLEATSLV